MSSHLNGLWEGEAVLKQVGDYYCTFEKYIFAPDTLSPICQEEKYSSPLHASSHDILTHYARSPEATYPSHCFLKLWAKINIASFKQFLSGILSQ